MKRREFITLVGGAAAGWPLSARAQQGQRVRRIGMLIGLGNNADGQARVSAFRRALQELGWTDDRKIQVDLRWAPGNSERAQPIAEELIGTAPDIIFASPASMMTALRRQATAIPIVFVQSGDPVRAGFVQSHSRPGGNVTGFLLWEASINTKYLQLLKDIAPEVTRVAVLQNPDNTSWRGDLAAMEVAARLLAMTPIPTPIRSPADIEQAIAAFARDPKGGIIVPPDNTTLRSREQIVSLAAKHHLPAVYASRSFVAGGGLMSYAADSIDIYHRAAGYVDRILKGEKAGDLPVQLPTKYELVINLKTAKALGLTIPTTLLARADEVIE